MLPTSGRDSALSGLTSTITHIGILTAISNWRTGSVTETAYSGYARQAISWSAAADTTDGNGRKQTNSGTLTFPANGGADFSAIALAGYTASSGGTLKHIQMLDVDDPVIGTWNATGDLITAYAHGLSTDQRVFVMAIPGGAEPNVVAENTAYFVLSAGLTADAFAISTSSGGAAVNATANGLVMVIPYTAQTIAANGSLTVAAGEIEIQM